MNSLTAVRSGFPNSAMAFGFLETKINQNEITKKLRFEKIELYPGKHEAAESTKFTDTKEPPQKA